ncbi:hypothetical protein [Variovorax saccharolyticus]|uniref:hypothetical protein n=1 Tax=Variovorax saccharolyticus TaxID=3053516 RepID=UPI0025772001|nr:hypothetical protein [Variovorax sp. J31P216]MDM0030456.1 hypothetical protein [Variovorax sp. J31P216]
MHALEKTAPLRPLVGEAALVVPELRSVSWWRCDGVQTVCADEVEQFVAQLLAQDPRQLRDFRELLDPEEDRAVMAELRHQLKDGDCTRWWRAVPELEDCYVDVRCEICWGRAGSFALSRDDLRHVAEFLARADRPDTLQRLSDLPWSRQRTLISRLDDFGWEPSQLHETDGVSAELMEKISALRARQSRESIDRAERFRLEYANEFLPSREAARSAPRPLRSAMKTPEKSMKVTWAAESHLKSMMAGLERGDLGPMQDLVLKMGVRRFTQDFAGFLESVDQLELKMNKKLELELELALALKEKLELAVELRLEPQPEPEPEQRLEPEPQPEPEQRLEPEQKPEQELNQPGQPPTKQLPESITQSLSKARRFFGLLDGIVAAQAAAKEKAKAGGYDPLPGGPHFFAPRAEPIASDSHQMKSHLLALALTGDEKPFRAFALRLGSVRYARLLNEQWQVDEHFKLAGLEGLRQEIEKELNPKAPKVPERAPAPPRGGRPRGPIHASGGAL